MRMLVCSFVLSLFAVCCPVQGSAQEYHAAYHVLKTPKGAILYKETGYESGDDLSYSFECLHGSSTLAFLFFNPPDWGDPSSEGDDFESHMPFSVDGLNYYDRCGPRCSKIFATLNDPPDEKPSGGLYGPMSWRTFNAHINQTITDEPRSPEWHGYDQFRADALKRIAEFRKLCGR